jgi:hypothetical protein
MVAVGSACCAVRPVRLRARAPHHGAGTGRVAAEDAGAGATRARDSRMRPKANAIISDTTFPREGSERAARSSRLACLRARLLAPRLLLCRRARDPEGLHDPAGGGGAACTHPRLARKGRTGSCGGIAFLHPLAQTAAAVRTDGTAPPRVCRTVRLLGP